MPFTYKQPDERNRSPKVEILPDLRQRITRVYDLTNDMTKLPVASGNQTGLSAYLLPWGTADAEYPALLLVKQDFTGQFEESGSEIDQPNAKPPKLTRVFETISPTGETQVGEPDVTIDQDGLTEVTLHFLQFSIAVAGITPIYQRPGTSFITSPAPDSKTCVLKDEVRTDDGTLQRIDRHYISAGEISTTTDIKYNGALTLQTLVYVDEVPPTPGGYTVVDKKEDHPGGLPVYTYTFALGTGQISLQTEYRLSPDQGVTGVTVTTIKYLTPPGTGNPITGPGGSEEISITYEEQDGYRIWTGIYASGQGIISTEIELRFDDKLQITTITQINAVPTTPAASLGGTVVLIKKEIRNGTRFEDGTIIYTYTYAEAAGGATGAQIGIDVQYTESINQGVDGVTKTTIRQIVAPGSSMAPAAFGGSVLIKDEYADFEGYGIWTTTWAKGTGLVVNEYEVRESGALVTYHTVGLGAAPSAPSSMLGGSVVLVNAGTRNADGYQIYDYHWAEGYGLAVDESEVLIVGALTTYHRVSLGLAPTTPAGAVTQIGSMTREEAGYTVYDYRWATGSGQVSLQTRGEGDGALIYTYTALDALGTLVPAGSGYLVMIEHIAEKGYFRNVATYHVPPATVGYNKTIDFDYPGSVGFSSPEQQLVLQPPVRMRIEATVTVSYATAQASGTPFTVKQYCGFTDSYTVTSSGQTVSDAKALTGYLGGGQTVSGSNSTYAGQLCSSWQATIVGSNPSAGPSGTTTISVENFPYLTDVTGVVVFKRVVTTYSF